MNAKLLVIKYVREAISDIKTLEISRINEQKTKKWYHRVDGGNKAKTI